MNKLRIRDLVIIYVYSIEILINHIYFHHNYNKKKYCIFFLTQLFDPSYLSLSLFLLLVHFLLVQHTC